MKLAWSLSAFLDLLGSTWIAPKLFKQATSIVQQQCVLLMEGGIRVVWGRGPEERGSLWKVGEPTRRKGKDLSV